MTYDFTAADVIAKVRELAAEQPDFVYQPVPCVNVEVDDNGQWVGSCIVGRAVVDLGIPADYIARVARNSDATALLSNFEIPFTPEEMNWIEKVQENQDHGTAWRRAAAEAEVFYPSISGLSEAEIDSLRAELEKS